jgi:hypothetical protein
VGAVQQSQTVTETGPGPSPTALSGADEWLTPGRFAAVLALLIFAAFPQVLLCLETFVVRDYGFFAFPLAHYQRECFWHGKLPFWDPYNNCGVPFLAQWNTMPLYPPSLIYLLLPLKWSLSFFCLLHLFWAGLGMYFLAHRWTGNRLGAALAGVIFSFNGLTLNLLMWPSHIATVSWMPWVVLTVELGWREGGRRLIVAGIAGACQMLAGGPEGILFTWLILSGLWLMQLVRPEPPNAFRGESESTQVTPFSRRAALWRFPVLVLLVAALAAIQLFPFLDLAAHSQREQGFADTRWSMPARGWANFFVPMVFGSTWRQNLFFQYGQYWTTSYYLGIGAILVGLFALWRGRNGRVWFLAAVATVGFILAGGDNNPLSRNARRLIPQLTLMTYPVKYVLLVVFATPLLAAFGLRQWRAVSGAPKARHQLLWVGALLLLVIGGILIWAWRWPMKQDDVSATLVNGLSRAGFLAVGCGLLLVLGRASQPMLQRVVPLLLLALFWLDVWTHLNLHSQNPTVRSEIYEIDMARKYLVMQPQPELGQSRAMVAPEAETKFMQLALNDPQQNFLAKRLGYFADCNLLDSVPKINGFFSLYPRECGELSSALYVSTNVCPPRLADFMAVSQVTAPGEYVKWQTRDSFLPLVTAGQQPVFLDDAIALSFLIGPDFDGTKFVFLPLEARNVVSATNAVPARVLQQQFKPEQVDAEVEAAAPSLVVISQTYYHQWRAFVDGRETNLLRANYAFQAVPVPQGRHHVRLVYVDHAFRIGCLISAGALFACMAFGLGSKRLTMRRPGYS